MNTKTIFLDIDGVLVRFGERKVTNYAVDNLLDIINFTGCQIVLSSAWRIGDWKTDLIKAGAQQIVNHIVDVTPFGSTRDEEIQPYLDYHPEIDQYVVIDDMFLKNPNLVHTDPYELITDEIYGLIMQKLGGN